MTTPQSPESWHRSSDPTTFGPAGTGGHAPSAEATSDGDPGVTRRDFLALLGASAALATACTRLPRERILPYTVRPPEVTPGVALHYATAMTLDGYATGLLVESHEGRPTKIEGNPDHPASFGAAGVYEQASVLSLYDPDRARQCRIGGHPAEWDQVRTALDAAALGPHVGTRGAGLHLLVEPTASPLLASVLSRVCTRFPEAAIHWYAPLSFAASREATRRLLGQSLEPVYDFRSADIVVALDADVLATGPFHLRYARDFAGRRRIRTPQDSPSRLYVAEPAPTPTGSLAEHRLRAAASQTVPLLAGLIARLADLGVPMPDATPALTARIAAMGASSDPRWLDAVARDLRDARGRGVVVVGRHQPIVAHAMAIVVNAMLGNAGRTVSYVPSAIGAVQEMVGNGHNGLATIADAVQARQVDTLVILEGNPVYTAPGDRAFAESLHRVPHTVYLGLYENETARFVDTFVPAAHYLETWADARAYDGTLSVVQPLIIPFYGGKTAAEVLAALAGTPADAYTLVRTEWQAQRMTRGTADAASFDGAWDDALRRGLVPGSQSALTAPAPRLDGLSDLLASILTRPTGPIEIAVRQSPTLHDGRFANNGWLQELPDPSTKLTWGNAARVSPTTAARLGIASGDVVRLAVAQRSLETPVLVEPGHVDNALTLALGYGREGAERVARDVGTNVYAIWSLDEPAVVFGALTRVVDGAVPVRRRLATTQEHWSMEGRPIVLEATIDQYRAQPDFTARQRGRTLSVYQPYPERGDQWAMTIDLSLCTGCSACVVACQAENNIPVVGADGVRASREMHWLRIDRYVRGSPDDPEFLSQPMLCQHCEQAPCEYVCPVNATVHSEDGLNEMVYNRCVGTRFCSNNCPYKVRRFNWFDYNADLTALTAMVENPDVTVRDRGVMEKCTFCVQRIRRAQIEAGIEERPVRDGEVVTACQQACPTQAIVFGSQSDPLAAVAQRLREPRSYTVLHDLGTEPRVRYLARITNPGADPPGDA